MVMHFGAALRCSGDSLSPNDLLQKYGRLSHWRGYGGCRVRAGGWNGAAEAMDDEIEFAITRIVVYAALS